MKANPSSGWQEFRIESLDQPNCLPFSKVAHVSHIKSCLTILEEGRIRAGLVDKGKLSTQRILVSWLSPNEWNPGFRYGTVRFRFDWANLFKGMNYYWVESIDYKVPACRILVTPEKHPDLMIYNPRAKDGPWWYVAESGKHYFNDKCCLEFMVEHDLLLNGDVQIDFVSHRRDMCSVNRENPKSCPEIRMSQNEAAALFLAGIFAQNIRVPKDWFRMPMDEGYDSEIPTAILSALRHLRLKLITKDVTAYYGSITHDDKSAIGLARSACNLFFHGMKDELHGLRGLFEKKEDFKNSLARLVAKHFELSDWQGIFHM